MWGGGPLPRPLPWALDSGPYKEAWWLPGCWVVGVGQGLHCRAGRPKAETLCPQWDQFCMNGVVARGTLKATTQTGSCCSRDEFSAFEFLFSFVRIPNALQRVFLKLFERFF